MTHLKTKSENPHGLHQKYFLSRVDGVPIPDTAKFFVLRLDDGGDSAHIAASRKAILTYANEIESHLPQLAKDIREAYSPRVTLPNDFTVTRL